MSNGRAIKVHTAAFRSPVLVGSEALSYLSFGSNVGSGKAELWYSQTDRQMTVFVKYSGGLTHHYVVPESNMASVFLGETRFEHDSTDASKA